MRFAHLIPMLGLGALMACGGGGSGDGGTTNPPPPAAVSFVSLSRTTALLKPSESTTITATPEDASGNALTDRAVTWTVVPTSGIVSISPNGASVTITGAANGTATVTATSETKPADAHITVTNSIPTSADVDVGANGDAFTPSDTDILAGGSVNFTWHAVTHNVTWLTTPASETNSGDRSSGTLSFTLTQPGTYNYHCTIHAGMNGSVTVH